MPLYKSLIEVHLHFYIYIYIYIYHCPTGQLRTCRVAHEEKKQAFASAASQSDLVVKMMAAAAPGGPLARVGLHGRLGTIIWGAGAR